MYFTEKEEFLEHHGIRGQKWGIRRFQNKDGTRTAAGKVREQGESGSKSSGSGSSGSKGINIDKKQLAKGAAIAGAVALGAVLITNPGARNVLAKYGKTAVTGLGSAIGKGAANSVNFAGKVGKKTGERLDKAADAMIDAALVSVGGIAISKVSEKLAADENASEAEKNKSKVLTDTVTAGIKTATGAGITNNSGNGGGNKGGNVGKEVTDKLGAPSNKGVDKQSKEWGDLFRDVSSPEVRGTIKSLASQGYDIDQLQEYKRQFGHADFENWLTQYMGVEIGV